MGVLIGCGYVRMPCLIPDFGTSYPCLPQVGNVGMTEVVWRCVDPCLFCRPDDNALHLRRRHARARLRAGEDAGRSVGERKQFVTQLLVNVDVARLATLADYH